MDSSVLRGWVSFGAKVLKDEPLEELDPFKKTPGKGMPLP
jgi:hypothetical protein